MKYFSFILLFQFAVWNTYSADIILFEVGKRDSSAAEFALFPDRYKSFLAAFGGEILLCRLFITGEKLALCFAWASGFLGRRGILGWLLSEAFPFLVFSVG